MIQKIYSSIALICCVLGVQSAVSQGCNVPLGLCQSDGAMAFTTTGATATPLPNEFCFSSTHTIFLEFNTLTAEYIAANGTNFTGSAVVEISGLNCDAGQFGTPSIAAAVVAAGNPCIQNSYGTAVNCVEHTQASSFSLSLTGLLPDTTYYIVINTQSVEDGSEFDCDFNVSVDGPAVLYDLNATGSPLSLISGETATLTSNSGFENYNWEGENLQETNTQNTEVTLENEGQGYIYTVSASIHGCLVTDQVLIQVEKPITIYNTLTPNGDGINDTWVINGLERFPDAEVRVYSRWGQQVYRTRGYQPWSGDDLPEGVYYYVIELNPLGFETRPYTGSLNIIR